MKEECPACGGSGREQGTGYNAGTITSCIWCDGTGERESPLSEVCICGHRRQFHVPLPGFPADSPPLECVIDTCNCGNWQGSGHTRRDLDLDDAKTPNPRRAIRGK